MRASLAIVAVLAACGAGSRQVEAPAPPVAPFVEGVWAYADGSGTEEWRPVGGMLVGIAFIGDSFEVMFIDGDRLIAMPGGAKPTEFVADERGPESVTFRNEVHDFPTAVTYALVDGNLVATLEGRDGQDTEVPPITMVPIDVIDDVVYDADVAVVGDDVRVTIRRGDVAVFETSRRRRAGP